MRKPQSMSVKEWLIKKMAISMVVSEKIIDSVVTHQFDSANDALNTNDSIEISGFGKFYFNKKKAVAHYEKLVKIKQAYENILADPSITDKKRHNVEMRMKSVLNDIRILKPKIDHEHKSDI
jgi:nucleoid DNA-binding protein